MYILTSSKSKLPYILPYDRTGPPYPPKDSILFIIKLLLGPGPASSTGVAESIATCRCKLLINQIIFKPKNMDINQKNIIKNNHNIHSMMTCHREFTIHMNYIGLLYGYVV